MIGLCWFLIESWHIQRHAKHVFVVCRRSDRFFYVIFMFQDSANNEVELKVLLPDRNICVVTIHRNDTTDNVYSVSIKSYMNNVAVCNLRLTWICISFLTYRQKGFEIMNIKQTISLYIRRSINVIINNLCMHFLIEWKT